MFAEQLEVLRERNKFLMNKLKVQMETLERLSGREGSRKREREDREEEEERRRPEEEEERVLHERRRPEEEEERVLHERRRPEEEEEERRRPEERFADTDDVQTDVRRSVCVSRSTRKHRHGTELRHSEVFDPRGQSEPVHTRSTSVSHSERSGVQSPSGSQSDECEDVRVPGRHYSQTLLGYDWIAGVLDTDDSLMERSDDFYDDLHVFRLLNKDECVPTAHSQFSEDVPASSSPPEEDGARRVNADTHQCTFSYRINSRLFPVPLRPEESCPVCKKHKSSHPHTMSEPALIRVSIPRCVLLPPYKYKAHRRCSFDPSDSLGLPSHCLSGWSNSGQTTLPPPGSLDLKSSLHKKETGSIKELENLSEPKVSGGLDRMPQVSRLARHNFQHFAAKRKAYLLKNHQNQNFDSE